MRIKLILLTLTIYFILIQNAFSQEYLIFGGNNHDKFLGCLNCSKSDSGSICNKYGNFGNKFSIESIFNKFGTFGNKFSISSPWNKYSSGKDVPVLVDRAGNFYGYFTINSYRSDAFSNSNLLKEVFEESDGDYEILQSYVCKLFSK